MRRIKKIYDKYSPVKRNTQYLERVVLEQANKASDSQNDLHRKIDELAQKVEEISSLMHQSTETQQRYQDESNGALDVILQTVNKVSVDTGTVSTKIMQRPISVLFLLHNIEVWSSLSEVYRLMNNDARFAVQVVSCARRYPNSDIYQNEELVSEILAQLEIPHVRLTSDDSYRDLDIIKRMRPDVILRQSKWDIDIPPAFSTQDLRFARLYSVSYGVLPMLEHSFADGPSYFGESIDTLFVTNDTVGDMYNDRTGGTVATTVTGHPRVDEILRAKTSWPIQSGNKFRVLWSAHHSIFQGWNDFGTFLTTYPLMLKLAKKHTDVDFLFSPHPGLLGAFERLKKEDEQARQAVDEFLTTWEKLPNTDTIHNGGYIEPMKASNLLVVDGVSLLMEYQLIQQPIVCLEREGHGAFNEVGEKIMQGVNRVPSEDGDAVCKKIEYFINGGEDDTRKFQKENVKFLTQYTHAAKKIVDHIAKDFGK